MSLSWNLAVSIGYSDIFLLSFILLRFKTFISLLCAQPENCIVICWVMCIGFLKTGKKCSLGTKRCFVQVSHGTLLGVLDVSK